MNETMSTIKDIKRPQLMLLFVLLSGLIAPGAATLWVFDPSFIYTKELPKIIFLSFVLTSAPAFFNFIVITIYSYSKGNVRDNVNISTEFTLAIMAVATAYFIMVLSFLIFKPSIITFAISVIIINTIMVIIFLRIMPEPKPNDKNT